LTDLVKFVEDITKHKIFKDLETEAAKNGWELNTDHKSVDEIFSGFIKNIYEYGDIYCPCAIIKVMSEEKRKDYICPCVMAKEQIERRGKCRCQLFWKKTPVEEKS
jgi:ferredoxin-thioredoxin reductase catalytic subunit